jgi:hypothetical protein
VFASEAEKMEHDRDNEDFTGKIRNHWREITELMAKEVLPFDVLTKVDTTVIELAADERVRASRIFPTVYLNALFMYVYVSLCVYSNLVSNQWNEI